MLKYEISRALPIINYLRIHTELTFGYSNTNTLMHNILYVPYFTNVDLTWYVIRTDSYYNFSMYRGTGIVPVILNNTSKSDHIGEI